jgi:hypothetical protein
VVARLVVEQQDVASKRGRAVAAFVEKLSFDPWHALVEHRPRRSDRVDPIRMRAQLTREWGYRLSGNPRKD